MSLFVNMNPLNLPEFKFKTQQSKGKTRIYDEIRKKYVALTPEEWVRQHIIRFLCEFKNYPPPLMAVETSVIINGLKQRADLVVYNRKGTPEMIVECKAPSVQITNQVFDQAARYNMTLNVSYLVISNGMNHFCAKLNYANNTYSFLKNIPDFNEL